MSDVSLSIYSLLFCELVCYLQTNVASGDELMDKLDAVGYPIGCKLIEATIHKHLKGKRPIRHAAALQAVIKAWKVYFGRTVVLMHAMSGNEKKPFEYIIKDANPLVSTYYSVPVKREGDRDLRDANGVERLRVTSFMSGALRGMLTTLGFPCTVRSGHKPLPEAPQQTLFQVTFDTSVRDRESQLPS
ncbi:hypothetical protein RCL1_002529 [Eukaryota sp. TZLM3-RCL]